MRSTPHAAPDPEEAPALDEHAFMPPANAGIVGIGVDVVDMDRLGDRLARFPRLRERLFAPSERTLGLASLAARVAAKEAVGKSLGNPGDLSWHDVTVRSSPQGRPYVVLRGASLASARALGVSFMHVSLSHDGRLATAMVVAERAIAQAGTVKGALS